MSDRVNFDARRAQEVEEALAIIRESRRHEIASDLRRHSVSDTSQKERKEESETVDFRNLEYVNPVNDHLMCPVCHCACISPLMTSCQHLFCANCFRRAMDSTEERRKSCPFCRKALEDDEISTAPRVFHNMLNDLQVKCPNSIRGCAVQTTRGDIQSHLDKYCGFTEIECPSKTCKLKIQRRLGDRECLHSVVACPDCLLEVVRSELDTHRADICPQRWMDCVSCSAQIVRSLESEHRTTCPEMTIRCNGVNLGCRYESKRSLMHEHVIECPLAMLAPIFAAQNDRIMNLEEENRMMKRKFAAFDVEFNPAHTTNSTANLPLLQEVASEGQNERAPFDSTAHHLLSLYESLRSELDRLSTSLTEFDARQSMTIMNENLRIKEDLAHQNAAIGSMRVQLHWLMSMRLQNQQLRGPGGPGQGGPSNGHGRGGQRSSGGMGESQSNRGLSDALRQDTKL